MNLNLSKHAQGAYTLRINGKGLEILKRIYKN
jgi:hypothetical protein